MDATIQDVIDKITQLKTLEEGWLAAYTLLKDQLATNTGLIDDLKKKADDLTVALAADDAKLAADDAVITDLKASIAALGDAQVVLDEIIAKVPVAVVTNTPDPVVVDEPVVVTETPVEV